MRARQLRYAPAWRCDFDEAPHDGRNDKPIDWAATVISEGIFSLMTERMYDLFITHAWRYHDDWTRVGEMFDKYLGDGWRNFSVPWYDPALDPNTDVGKRLVYRWLEQQIMPTCGVILLSSVYENKSAQKWVMLEVELARKYEKRIIGLPTFGMTEWRRRRRLWPMCGVPGMQTKLLPRLTWRLRAEVTFWGQHFGGVRAAPKPDEPAPSATSRFVAGSPVAFSSP